LQNWGNLESLVDKISKKDVSNLAVDINDL
jgi:hypothetical protein